LGVEIVRATQSNQLVDFFKEGVPARNQNIGVAVGTIACTTSKDIQVILGKAKTGVLVSNTRFRNTKGKKGQRTLASGATNCSCPVIVLGFNGVHDCFELVLALVSGIANVTKVVIVEGTTIGSHPRRVI